MAVSEPVSETLRRCCESVLRSEGFNEGDRGGVGAVLAGELVAGEAGAAIGED